MLYIQKPPTVASVHKSASIKTCTDYFCFANFAAGTLRFQVWNLARPPSTPGVAHCINRKLPGSSGNKTCDLSVLNVTKREFVRSPSEYFFKVPPLSQRFYGLFPMDMWNKLNGLGKHSIWHIRLLFYRSHNKTGTGCETLIFCLVLERKTQKSWVCLFF